MRRIFPFLVAGLLGACATSAPPPDLAGQPLADSAGPAGPDTLGEVGPDGGPLVADRGIGGTGIGRHPALALVASGQLADRGIGGTGIGDAGDAGIVGIVTGFGSVFVNGLEIQFDNAAVVDIDGNATSTSALRAGQLVAIRAGGPANAPYAKAISIRTEAMGRIDGLELGSGTLEIAGQRVSVPAGAWGANRFGLGDWVKVSGLRRADGVIVASRLDSAPAGALSARGQVAREDGVARVGHLALDEKMVAGISEGQFVVVSGSYAGGHGQIASVARDMLPASAGDYFGASANRLVLQGFVHANQGVMSMNGVKARTEIAAPGPGGSDGLAIVSLKRGQDGAYVASGLRYTSYLGKPKPRSRSDSRPAKGDAPQHGGRAPTTTAQPEPVESSEADGTGFTTTLLANDMDTPNGGASASPNASLLNSTAASFGPATPSGATPAPVAVPAPAVVTIYVAPAPASASVADMPMAVSVPVAPVPIGAIQGVAPAVSIPAASAVIAPPVAVMPTAAPNSIANPPTSSLISSLDIGAPRNIETLAKLPVLGSGNVQGYKGVIIGNVTSRPTLTVLTGAATPTTTTAGMPAVALGSGSGSAHTVHLPPSQPGNALSSLGVGTVRATAGSGARSLGH